jgi:MFS family permease
MCQGLTASYQGLLVVRFLMGMAETCLPAGAGLLIASYYRKKELSLRFAIFFAFGQSGSCFSGLLAYAIQGSKHRLPFV